MVFPMLLLLDSSGPRPCVEAAAKDNVILVLVICFVLTIMFILCAAFIFLLKQSFGVNYFCDSCYVV